MNQHQSPDDPLQIEMAKRVDQACNRFESAWKVAGSTDPLPRVEEYLTTAAEPEHSALLRELIALDVYYRQRRGEAACSKEYRERFPGLELTATTAPDAEVVPVDTVSAPPPAAVVAMDIELDDILAPPQGPDELGQLGPYRVLRALGAGGMGVVFEAEDPRLQRRVALKALRPALATSAAARQRFEREARAVAAIEHDHIIPIYQVDQDRGVPFLVMPLLRGESLEERLKRDGRLPVVEVLRIGRESAQGLAAAHERGLIHRDIKPANLWLEAGGDRVKILDFGLARAATSAEPLTQSGAILGTPAYMSPEQANGEVADQRSDLFSLGSVLYRLCTGQPPFQGKDITSTLLAVATAAPMPPAELNPQVPAALSRLILELLAKDPSGRPQSAGAVVEMIQAIERGKTDGAALSAQKRAGSGTPPVRLRRRLAVAAVALAGVLVLVGYLVGPALDRSDTNQGQLVVDKVDPPVSEETPPAVARRVWPIDALRREDIPAQELKVAGGGDAKRSPPELVAILGDSRMMHYPGLIVDVAFSPDGKKLATATQGGPKMWDAESGEEIPVFEDYFKSGRVNGFPQHVAFSRDGKIVAVDDQAGVKFWDAVTGQYRCTFPYEGNSFLVFTFSPDGRTLAVGGGNKVVRLWNAETGKSLRSFEGHDGAVASLAFSPDGKTLAVGGNDGVVRLWDMATGTLQQSLKGHAGVVMALAFSPDGKTLASGSSDNTVKLWDMAAGSQRVSLQPGGAVHAVVFSPDGKTLASGGPYQTVKLWNPATGKGVDIYPNLAMGVKSLAFSPDGKALAVGSMYMGIKLLDLATGKERLQSRGLIVSLAVSSDGATLATGTADCLVLLWDLATAKLRRTLRGHTKSVQTLAFSPDGKVLATGSASFQWNIPPMEVKLWDVASGNERHTLHQGKRVHALVFSPDSRTLAVGTDEPVVQLVDVASGTQRGTLQGHHQPVRSVAFSPDGRTLASGSGEYGKPGGEIKLWDVAGGKLRRTLPEHAAAVLALAFSPDGKMLVSGGGDALRPTDSGELKLWDMGTKAELRTLRRGGMMLSAAFSPDGKVVATSDRDMVEFWDPQGPRDGALLRRWLPLAPNHVFMNYQVAFTPEGRHLLTVNGNGTVYVLRLASPPQKEGE